MPSSTNNLTSPEVKAKLRPKLKGYIARNDEDDTVQFLETCYMFLPPDGQKNLYNDIWACQSNDELHELAEMLDTGLIRPLLANANHTPELGSSYSAEEDAIDLISSDYRKVLERLRKKCLQRDGNKCVISGSYDQNSDPPDEALKGPLEAAHILPSVLGGPKDERKASSDALANLYRYFPALRFRLKFTLEDINREHNAIMMLFPLDREFKAFSLILEATSTPNRYRVKTFPHFATAYRGFLPADGLVTLTSQSKRCQPPSPILLAVHAAIGNILHASGRGKTIGTVMQEAREDWACMAGDGSTDVGELLSVTSLALLASSDRARHHQNGRRRGKRRSSPPEAEAGRKKKGDILGGNDGI
ncbi:uncharacterized protein NFIA_034740 [Aspergillus fischeri NRRL 181]|uniref:HNH nuclease domain-containing protein n=1 Tax=Neosartorya fischeri (strain ATCC 1020 / DSM 3700 / CBS 544.65 / FGSC A1164 / JCM 1740 / NRRL 181 / WB 181) TaxID=331117 RepID=A1CYT6_NEOFI|nr:conserved hypothetical protein [Aspergillus fischeri NRRL 181]EAW23906.1 conserved hypothetical protein [Aspergillus fischeri NRRL 181]KAG2026817.1 hypothetical protein GB937_001607 [Aspergillus fischeri]